jgi:hypothetical protein
MLVHITNLNIAALKVKKLSNHFLLQQQNKSFQMFFGFPNKKEGVVSMS